MADFPATPFTGRALLTDSQPPAPAPTPRPSHIERVRTAAVVVIAVAIAFAGLYFGSEVFIPLGLSLVFTALLRPVVRWLERLGLRTGLAATLVVLVSIALLAGAAVAVTAPVQNWAQQAPQELQKAQQRLRKLVHSVDPVTKAVSGVTGGDEGGKEGGSQSGGGGGGPSGAGVAAKVFGLTTTLLTGLLEVLLLVWFLLASGDLFVRKLVHVLPLVSEKKRAVDVVHETESVVSRYMLVSLLMYLVQGTAVGLTAWLVGLPTPALWGMMTVLLEFIPYLGAAFMMILLTLIGLATFDSVGQALVTPGVYLLVSTIQNNLVSPFAYGRRLKLNPVAVLLSVMIWYGLWGIAGAFLAVPLVATIKVLADRVPGLVALGEFLGE